MTEREIIEGNKTIAEFDGRSFVRSGYDEDWNKLVHVCEKFRLLSNSKEHKNLCENFQYALFHMNIKACFTGLHRCIQWHTTNSKQINK